MSDYMDDIDNWDRGKAEYFHGRTEELNQFKKLLRISIKKNKGTIFLFQGSPGVGKTALLEKCKEIAKQQDWEVASINPGGLWDVVQLKKDVGLERKIKIPKFLLRLGFSWLGGQAELEFSQKRVLDVLKKGKTPLLLALDEAQRLDHINKPPDEKLNEFGNVLDQIHNGSLNRPLVLAVSGLSMTKNIFQKFGLSRLNLDHSIDLGMLDKESEKSIIRDWLVKKGKTKGDVNHWVERISQETHGWAQHITAYSIVASEELRRNRGVLTKRGLSRILKLGEQKRFKYYDDRLEGFDFDVRKSITQLINKKRTTENLTRKNIVDIFQKEYSIEESKNLFEKILSKGIVHINNREYYSIPIPSMRNWLLSEYGNNSKTSDVGSKGI